MKQNLWWRHPSKEWKAMSPTAYHTYTLLFTVHLVSGMNPATLKLMKVKPVIKQEDMSLTNYIHISIILAVCKILKK